MTIVHDETCGIPDILAACPTLLHDADSQLAVWLCAAKHAGESSAWAPYIRQLPVPETIGSWSAHELQELQDQALCARAISRERTIEYRYHTIRDEIESKWPGRIDWAAPVWRLAGYRWAWLTVQARAFGRRIPWPALVPFADNLNHGQVPIKYRVTKQGTFELYSTRGKVFRAGEEVLNSYGRRTNAYLLIEYGFALECNEWDYVPVRLSVKSARQLAGLPELPAAYRISLARAAASAAVPVSRVCYMVFISQMSKM